MQNLYPKEAKHTFFSNAHGTFLKIDHVVGHKTSLYKFKKVEITSSIFSDHNCLKLKATSGRTFKNSQIHGD